ncbi:unnamed protein product, partial [Cuscuta campestris]
SVNPHGLWIPVPHTTLPPTQDRQTGTVMHRSNNA